MKKNSLLLFLFDSCEIVLKESIFWKTSFKSSAKPSLQYFFLIFCKFVHFSQKSVSKVSVRKAADEIFSFK